MSRAKRDEKLAAIIADQLDPGEAVGPIAYGVQMPSFKSILGYMGLAIVIGIGAALALQALSPKTHFPVGVFAALPVVILYVSRMRNYCVGLTAARLIVVRLSMTMKPVETSAYPLAEIDPAKVESVTGPVFTHIKIDDPQKPFKAKFARAYSPKNREHAMAIAERLGGTQAP